MRFQIDNQEFVVKFFYPFAKERVGEFKDLINCSPKAGEFTGCYIKRGAVNSLDNDKDLLSEAKVQRLSNEPCNFMLARNYALFKALIEANVDDKVRHILWAKRTIRRPKQDLKYNDMLRYFGKDEWYFGHNESKHGEDLAF